MKKFFVISLIISLILLTAFIKNSTKRIDDEIFAAKENLRILENEFKDLKFEYTYLSSGKKLMELKSEFLDDHLITKNKDEIQFIKKIEIRKSE